MNDKVMNYKEKLKARLSDKPLWEKPCLTIEEAAEYSGIGRNKLRQLSGQKKCQFIIALGNQIFIVREKFDAYISSKEHI